MTSIDIPFSFVPLRNELNDIKARLNGHAKRILKKRKPKTLQVLKDIQDNLVQEFNLYTTKIQGSWIKLSADEKHELQDSFLSVRERSIVAFTAIFHQFKAVRNTEEVATELESLGKQIIIPGRIGDIINEIAFIDPEWSSDDEEESDTNTEADQSIDENSEDMATTFPEFLKQADTVLPRTFDGSPEGLTAFLDALTLLEALQEGNEARAATVVKTRLRGEARDLITNEATVAEIRAKLTAGIKAPTSKDIKAKMRGLRASNNPSEIAKQLEDLSAKLKRSYLSEGVPLETAEGYCVEQATLTLSRLAATEHVQTVIESGYFKTVQAVTAKFVSSSQGSNSAQVSYFRRGDRRGQQRSGNGNWNNNRNNNRNGNRNGNSNNYNNNYNNNNRRNSGQNRNNNGNNQRQRNAFTASTEQGNSSRLQDQQSVLGDQRN